MKRTVATCHSAAVLFSVMSLFGAAPLRAAEEGDVPHIERNDWSFAGFGGQYDRAQLQRGFQVYQQVCAACHGLKRVRFRNLAEKGGPAFPLEAVKALAASWPYTVAGELNDEGKMGERLPTLADPIIGPYKNDKEARSIQNGALPPDLSLIVNARTVANHSKWYAHVPEMAWDILRGYQEGGADYLVALLTGYADQPPPFKRDAEGHLVEVPESEAGDGATIVRCAPVTRGDDGNPDKCNELQDGMNYNVAFPGRQIAMPPPMSKDSVIDYQPDAGAKASFEQNARDVTAFLAWAGNPNLDARKQLGWQVLLYLLITTVLLYLVKKRIWARLKH